MRYGETCDDVEHAAHRILNDRLKLYYKEQDYFFAGTENIPDLSREPIYEKRCLPIGYVKATDMYPAGTYVTVRMIEGDIPFAIKEDTYFMIGPEGEVYKNDEAYFISHNDYTDEPFKIKGEYAPTVHLAINASDFPAETGKMKSLQDYAKTCIPKSGSRIHARQLTRRTKVFVNWSDSYLLGKPGDFLVAREENPRDLYIVAKDIMEKSYVMV